MLIVRDTISARQLKTMAQEMFGSLVKAVVDVERRVMAARERRIEFDSLINIRPWQGNRSRGVEDSETRRAVVEIVEKLVKE